MRFNATIVCWLFTLIVSCVHCLTIDYRHYADALGCRELAHVAIGNVHFRTARKETLRAKLNQSVDVAIERPYDGANFWARLNATTAAREDEYVAYFRKERLLARRLAGEFVPTLLGGCYASFGTLVHVTEPLRRLVDVAEDALVDWRQRVRIAINAVRSVSFLDAMPIGKRAIYGDTWPSHFGVDAELGVKFLDFQSFFAYDTRFGLYKCQETVQCHEKFWESDDHPKVLLGLRDLAPDDFRCLRGQCNGVDTLTQLMAVCKMLIEPLFTNVELPSEARGVHAVIKSCLQLKRVDRPSPAVVIASLEKIVPSRAKLRPLQM
jgi:hypothetical protein